MMIINPDALKEQIPLPGFFGCNLEEQTAKTYAMDRILLGDEGYSILYETLGREPTRKELSLGSEDYRRLGFDPDAFKHYLEERYNPPLEPYLIEGSDPPCCISLPMNWRVIVGAGGENAGIVYIGSNPLLALQARKEYLQGRSF